MFTSGVTETIVPSGMPPPITLSNCGSPLEVRVRPFTQGLVPGIVCAAGRCSIVIEDGVERILEDSTTGASLGTSDSEGFGRFGPVVLVVAEEAFEGASLVKDEDGIAEGGAGSGRTRGIFFPRRTNDI